jgi:chromosome segregation ATPase
MDRWRREVNENMELIRGELAEIQELREYEDNRWNEVHVNLRDMRKQAQAFKQHLLAAAKEFENVRAEQQEMGEWKRKCTQQQEELRTQIGRMDERMGALKEHCGATSEKLRREVEQLHTDLQRMGRSIGRMEQERLETESGLKQQVEQLGQCTQQLREELARTQGALQMLLAEANRSTVGSAGLSWAW